MTTLIDQLNSLNNDASSASVPVPVVEPKKKKEGGFNFATFNPMMYLVQFGIESINTNMESMQTNALQIQQEEKVLADTNKQLGDLINKSIEVKHKHLSTWGKIFGIADIAFAVALAPVTGGLSMALAVPGILEFAAPKVYENDNFFEGLVWNGGMDGTQLLDAQAKQQALNNITEQTDNGISLDVKMGIEDPSEKDTQLAQIVTQEIQTMGQVMNVKLS